MLEKSPWVGPGVAPRTAEAFLLFTTSAASPSDLEATRSVSAVMVDAGNFIQGDGHRDIALLRVHEPVMVSRLIGQAMTVPLVRVDGRGSLPATGGEISR